MPQKNEKKSPSRKYHNVTSLKMTSLKNITIFEKKNFNKKQQQQQ